MINGMEQERPSTASPKQPVRLHPRGEPPTHLLSTREAATLLGASERTIRRAIVAGELAAMKVGSAYRLNRASLDAYAAQTGRNIVPVPLPHLLPPLEGAGQTPLPTLLSTFIGREDDIAAVVARLQAEMPRVLTLTGPGGIGKTRLALAAATAVPRSRFRDGIVFVALADVPSASAVLPAVAQALGLRERHGQAVAAQLFAYLRHRQILLVLDNFERLLAAGGEVVALLNDAPGMKMLITSRTPLRVAGEHEYAVRPLRLGAGAITPPTLLASDAGRLFVERAREHDHAFTVDAANAPLIAAICARLDGLPLAIELAAARVHTLAPQELLARLDRRLPLLTRGARDAPARHATMRDAISWSYDALPPVQQRVFRQLSVFAGGATLAAAEEVCVETEHVVDAIAELVDHALLLPETGLDGERRFRMLETIREFGQDAIIPSERSQAQSRRAAYFLSLTRELRPLASTHASPEVVTTFAAEYANLNEALTWFDTQGEREFVELAADLCEFWYASSFGREAGVWLDRVAAKLAQASPFDQGRFLVGQAALLLQQGDDLQAEPLLVRGLALLRQVGDPLYLSRALIIHGAILAVRGDFAAAETPLQESLALAEGLADPVWRAAAACRALTNLCVAARGQGDLARARDYGERSLSVLGDMPLAPLRATALNDLGAVAFDSGDYEVALRTLLEGIALMGERGDMRQVADSLSIIACIATAWDDAKRALRLFGAAEVLRERSGSAMVWRSDIAAVEQSFAHLRERVSPSDLAEMLVAGRALSLPEAGALANELTSPGVRPAVPPLLGILTRREGEILRLLAEQRTDREIAAQLYLSLRTVNWHVRSIIAKLGADSRRDAVAKAREYGVIG